MSDQETIEFTIPEGFWDTEGTGPTVDPAVDATDPDSPWHGIPAELLDGRHSYDTDSTGGCG